MKFFTEPTVEVEKFEMLDVIATSTDPTPTEPAPDWGMGGEDF